MWVKRLGMVIGTAWIVYAGDLLIRETVSAISGPLELSSYLAALLQVALLILAAVLLIFAIKGRVLTSVLVTLYVGFGHFIFLSNTWYEPGFDTWFAMAVVGLTLLTVFHAILVWMGFFRNHPEEVSSTP
jgi:hypothetical protein